MVKYLTYILFFCTLLYINQTVKAMNTYTFDSDFLDEYVVEDFRFDRSVSHLVLDGAGTHT